MLPTGVQLGFRVLAGAYLEPWSSPGFATVVYHDLIPDHQKQQM